MTCRQLTDNAGQAYRQAVYGTAAEHHSQSWLTAPPADRAMQSLGALEARLAEQTPRAAPTPADLPAAATPAAAMSSRPRQLPAAPGPLLMPAPAAAAGPASPALLQPPRQPPAAVEPRAPAQSQDAAMVTLLLDQVARLQRALAEARGAPGGGAGDAGALPPAVLCDPQLLPPLLAHYDSALARLQAAHAPCPQTAAALAERVAALARDNDALHAEARSRGGEAGCMFSVKTYFSCTA
jgi:hypothetical protein